MLAEGSHAYYFEFKDATNTVFLPVGPQGTGPTVTAPAPAPPPPAPPGATPGAPPPPPETTSPTDTPGLRAFAFLVAAGITGGVPRRRVRTEQPDQDSGP